MITEYKRRAMMTQETDANIFATVVAFAIMTCEIKGEPGRLAYATMPQEDIIRASRRRSHGPAARSAARARQSTAHRCTRCSARLSARRRGACAREQGVLSQLQAQVDCEASAHLRQDVQGSAVLATVPHVWCCSSHSSLAS